MSGVGAQDEKRLAARYAAGLVEDGMRVGLGSGTTVAALIPALAERALRVLRLAPADWQRMSEQAHATAAPHSWERSTDLFERALQRAAVKQAATRHGGVAVQAA